MQTSKRGREKREGYAKDAKKKQPKLNGVRYHLICEDGTKAAIKWYLTPFNFGVAV